MFYPTQKKKEGKEVKDEQQQVPKEGKEVKDEQQQVPKEGKETDEQQQVPKEGKEVKDEKQQAPKEGKEVKDEQQQEKARGDCQKMKDLIRDAIQPNKRLPRVCCITIRAGYLRVLLLYLFSPVVPAALSFVKARLKVPS